jgi:hypothetical protein
VASESPLDRGRERDAARPVLVVAALALSVLAGSVASLTWPAVALVAVVGGTIVGYGLLRGPQRRLRARDRLDPVGIWAWMALVLAFSTWELFAFFHGSTPAHPTVSILLDPLFDDHVVRSAAFFGWLSLGAYLVRQ